MAELESNSELTHRLMLFLIKPMSSQVVSNTIRTCKPASIYRQLRILGNYQTFYEYAYFSCHECNIVTGSRDCPVGNLRAIILLTTEGHFGEIASELLKIH